MLAGFLQRGNPLRAIGKELQVMGLGRRHEDAARASRQAECAG